MFDLYLAVYKIKSIFLFDHDLIFYIQTQIAVIVFKKELCIFTLSAVKQLQTNPVLSIKVKAMSVQLM